MTAPIDLASGAPAMNRRDTLIAGVGALAVTGLATGVAARPSDPRHATGASSGRAIVRSAADTRRFDAIPGEEMLVRVGAADTGGAYSLLESIVRPGAATPLHYHPDADEVFLILEGSLRITCADEKVEAPPGTTVVIPRGTLHGFINAGDRPARSLAVFSPGGMEELFARLAATPVDQWDALTRRYGTVIAGPPVT